MKNLTITLQILSITLFFTCQQSKDVQKTNPPNIILIMTDDQGYGDLGFTGNSIIKTPNLDQLGKASVSFTNFHVGTTCAPTRAGLLSGMYCNRTGTWHTVNGRSFLGTKFPTIATYLKKGGYRTGIFGKWHLGDNYPFRPQDRGFDEVLIHGGGGVGQTPDFWNNDYYDDTYFYNGTPKKYKGYCTDIWFDEAMNFIKESAAQEHSPFFCYISTNAPHGPHHVPQQYIDMYKNDDRVPNPNFYGQITNVDDNFGKLEKMLSANGLLENTIIIFLTDNGTSAGAKFDKSGQVTQGYNAQMRGKKGSEYEGGHRVPLFIKFPKHKNVPSKSYDQLVSYMDILPTLLEVVGLDQSVTNNFDGTSILPLIQAGKQEELNKRILISDTQRNDFPIKWKNASVMLSSWRLVNNEELYHLKNDPSQKENVLLQYPEITQQLAQGYDTWWASLQADLKLENRIIIGSEEENPTQLTCHDWHTDRDPPWHQQHIRTGKSRNGTWWLEVAEAGDYRIKLYRYPPDQNMTFTATVPKGEQVDGGQPYPIGVGMELKSATIEIQGQTLIATQATQNIFFEFNLKLKKGKANLKATFTDDAGAEFGAYYVEVDLSR
ncbi:MAG: arylsulfatase [Bacteroidota bacterium]